MSDAFRIHWRNKETGQTGIGPKEFTEAEAAAICQELNADYPNMEHAAIPADAAAQKPNVKKVDFTADPAIRDDTLTDDSPMPFGKWKGTPMKDVPSHALDYLQGMVWLVPVWPEVAAYITKSRKAINQDLEREGRE
jgi:hypothetical protein